jgi:hypothetical protein
MDATVVMDALVELLRTGIWAGVAVYAIRTAATMVHAWRPGVPASADAVEIPEDLVALAMAHRESWAQEDLLRVIRERYDELQDWNRVRAAMNIGRIDG